MLSNPSRLFTGRQSSAALAGCAALQEEFDNAEANNSATRARTGYSNADLMRYIDAWLERAGCF
jgi:hypothetical protein